MARSRFKTIWWRASAAISVVLMLFLLPRPETNPTGDPDGEALYAIDLMGSLVLILVAAAVLGLLAAFALDNPNSPRDPDDEP